MAELVLADPAAAARSTIVELAERSGTSPATVTRFCRALGFDGYAELRLGHRRRDRPGRAAGGWTVDIGREIQPTDPLERVLGQIMAADTRAMHDTASLLDLARGRAGRGGHRPAPTGSTSSAPAAAPWSARRCSSACTASASPRGPGPTCTTGWPAPRCCGAGDVALGISHSGQTRETIEMLAEAGSRGATTIALTSFPRSPLAELADIVLLTATQATTFRPDALSARHPQLVVLDLLYIAVAQRTHERAHAAFQRHRAGGRRAPVGQSEGEATA